RNATFYQTTILSIVVHSLFLIFDTSFFLIWFAYVCYKLYNRTDYLKRRLFWFIAPFVIMVAVIITSFFIFYFNYDFTTGVIAIISLLLFSLIRFFAFISSVRMVYRYKKQSGRLKFFNVNGFFIFMLAAIIIDGLFSKNIRSLGFSLAMLILYISEAAEYQYLSDIKGYYKTDYIQYLNSQLQKGTLKIGSSLYLHPDKGQATEALYTAIRSELPEECEPMIDTDGGIVCFTPVADGSLLKLIIGDVSAIAEELSSGGEEPISISGSYLLKGDDEPATAFIQRSISEYTK
ncbi:MAG: hypothetical protein J6N76_10655, partial [Lachnospiraceae bacterium]|nr:hypothetical protein [Lachnospiraceae bacterium]